MTRRRHNFGRLGRCCVVGAVGLLCLAGCTVQQKDEDNGNSAKGGQSSGSGGDTGTAGEGTAGEGTAGDGTAGAAALPCGETVTQEGSCNGNTLVYCLDDVVTEVDCATIGASCSTSGTTADCVELDRAVACGDTTFAGICNGAVIEYCDDKSGTVGVLRTINCAAYGQLCDPTAAEDGGALCVPQGDCPSDGTEEGSCAENVLSFCEGESLYSFDCGLDECRTVDGFADCFMADIVTGCEEETANGRCDGTSRVACLGNTIVTEDCSVVGLECTVESEVAGCRLGDCPSTCAEGYTCTTGRCAPTTVPTRDWTIAVYMVGDNNLSDAAWGDLNEMEVVGSSDQVAVVAQVEFSDTFSAAVPEDLRTGAYRMEMVSDDDTDVVASMEDATSLGTSTNMSDPDTLTDFVKWAAETYPAKNFALVMWDHGAAYRGGFMDEGVKNELMDLQEIVGGVRESGVHPNLVCFDACLMATHEVALAMRGVTDFLAASEEVEPGNGYPYDTILAALADDSTMTPSELGTVIADEFADWYTDGLRAKSVTQSVIDLSQVSTANDRLAEFAGTLVAELPANRVALRTSIAADSVLRFKMQDMADMRTALASLGGITGPLGTSASALETWFSTSSLIPHQRGIINMATATGYSVYLPATALSDYDPGTFETYRQVTDFLPLQAWHSALASLQTASTGEDDVVPGADAVDAFSVILYWGSEADGNTSNADLDLYVYEPNGEFAVPVNGTTSENGFLSGDSYDTEVPMESYALNPDHAAGTYIILAHLYDVPEGEQAFPRLQLIRSDLPGGSRTYARAKMVDRKLTEFPMDSSAPLTDVIDENNFQQVINLDFSNIWYAFSVEVKE